MTQQRLTSTLLISALLVSWGCATTRALSAPAPTPSSIGWANATRDVVAGTTKNLSRWWEQLDDATLTGLIERALQDSPDVHTAQARLRQARADRNVTRADLRPSLTGSGSASDRSDTGAFDAGFDASWEPDVFGGTRSAVEASTADLRATTAGLYATQVSLAAEVALNYVELRTLQTRLAIARRNEASQAETLQLTEFRAQAGLVSSVDVEQARANLDQTRAQLPSLEGSATQTIHRLSTLAGLEPSALTAELSKVADLPDVPAQVAIAIPAETLRQRPDVRAAEERTVAETARVAQSKTRRYPQFTLSGSIGIEILTGALTGGTSLVNSLASSVLQTIFDGGRIQQQIEIQNAVQQQAVASYTAVVLTALEEVENALVSFETTRQRLASLDSAATAANNAALLASNRYSAGLTDFQTVLDTQRTVLSIEDSIATTQGDRLIALVQLYKAVGGGWSRIKNDEFITGNTAS